MIELTVADLARSLAWYRDRFSFALLLHDEPHGFALLQAGTTKLAFKQGVPVPGNVRVVFETTHLDEWIRSCESLGDHLSPTTISAEGYRQTVLYDPDGHTLAVFEWLRGVSSPSAS